MTQFLQSLKEAAIFMLGAQILLYLGPGKKYEKYGKMIVSLLVLAQLAQPILELPWSAGIDSFSSYLNHYEQQNEAFLDRLELLDGDSEALVWEGMVQSVEEQLFEEASKLGLRIERVQVLDGRILVEAGPLSAGTEAVREEELARIFAEKLGVEADSLEVVVNGG